MKKHEVTAEELDAWASKEWVRFASSFGEQSRKTLEVGLDGLYRVTDHETVLYMGATREKAITEYNAAP